MGAGGPVASAVMADQVLSLVIQGEAKDPDRALFVDREYVSKLNSSGFFSFARLRFSSPPGTAYRWVDAAGQIVGVATPTGAPGGQPASPVGIPGGPEGVPPPELKRVEVTQFRVQTFVDTEGKLVKAVSELQKLYSTSAAPAAQP
jgi:hypothetical protein